jgi:hypothetical protein
MTKRPTTKSPATTTDHDWFIYRTTASRTGYLGLIRAPTAEAAIAKAAEEFKITAKDRKRLIAQRRD